MPHELVQYCYERQLNSPFSMHAEQRAIICSHLISADGASLFLLFEFYELFLVRVCTLEPRFRHLGRTVKNMCLNGDVLKSKNETRMQQNVLYTQLVLLIHFWSFY